MDHLSITQNILFSFQFGLISSIIFIALIRSLSALIHLVHCKSTQQGSSFINFLTITVVQALLDLLSLSLGDFTMAFQAPSDINKLPHF